MFATSDDFAGRKLVERATNWRARLWQFPYGDQGLFLRRDTFKQIGGFSDMPIMEDYEFVRRLRRLGKIAIAPAPAITSGRRWQRLGVLRTTLTNRAIILAYHLGISPSRWTFGTGQLDEDSCGSSADTQRGQLYRTFEMNVFEQKLAAAGLSLRRGKVRTLQINVGRKCNQTCRHCHVDAAPWRTEMMPEPIARRVGNWIREHRPEVVDITGGAPELSEYFRYFVETARDCGCHVIDRNNLTIIETAAYAWLPEYLAAHEVEIVASLPCYLEQNVNAQRGDGVFEKSIHALRKLNAVGYGSRLPLNLVYNPLGAKLPPPQVELEADYKRELR
jgi:uncharacterized radical SAM superfamily Fe-S cluster-containing enzyme